MDLARRCRGSCHEQRNILDKRRRRAGSGSSVSSTPSWTCRKATSLAVLELDSCTPLMDFGDDDVFMLDDDDNVIHTYRGSLSPSLAATMNSSSWPVHFKIRSSVLT